MKKFFVGFAMTVATVAVALAVINRLKARVPVVAKLIG